MKKILLVILMVFALSTAVTAADTEKNVLKVGVNAEYPPFEYYENGTLAGFDIDLMNCIGERIGYKIEYKDMPFDALFHAIMSGNIECAISTISVTDDRDKEVDFSVPYMTADVKCDSDGKIEEYVERYAIMFPQNFVEKARLCEAAGEPFIYNLVNNAIYELIKDGTAEKLAEKHGIGEVEYENYFYRYYIPPVEKIPSELTYQMPSTWARADIEKAAALNITNRGVLYNYRQSITREEFCELIYNYCANVIKEVDTVTGENPFIDTTNSNIIRLNAMGIINGKSETEFEPDDYLTREEAAVILNRMVNKTIPVPVTEMYFNFDDESGISDWAKDAVQIMCNMGVMNGVGENRFAPQDTYTTEQAIATIVRVYAAQSANTGIIGGADTPTEIYIGEEVEVDEFYLAEALKHASKIGELAGTKEFIAMYTPDDDVKAAINRFAQTDLSKPAQKYYVSYNTDKVVEYYEKLFAEENPGEEVNIEKYVELNRFNLSMIATMLNGRYGPEALAATTVLRSREGYIMPDDYTTDFGIYLKYEGDYSVLVSFSKIGNGVIEANAQLVHNSKKDDILMFMSEIYDALGEESITLSKIK